MIERSESMSGAGEAGANLTDLLGVGTKVRIVKPRSIDRANCFWWTPEMDRYDGKMAVITSVLDRPEDQEINAYDLDVDDGEFGWLHTFLVPV